MYIVTVLVYCILCMLMIKLLVHITLPMPCLVSMNLSSDNSQSAVLLDPRE